MPEHTEARALPRLSAFEPGEALTIVGVLVDPAEGASAEVAGRLRALGFVPGTRVEVLRRAPLGDPVEYGLRGTRVSLRRSEARHVQVTPKDQEEH
jgi:Fe2+ transport system protein FeoA